MHLSRTRRRALLAAALPAALAAAALPAAAEAATAAVAAGPVLEYSETPGETNQVFIRVNTILDKLVISDTAPITARNGCTLNAAGDAECPTNVDLVNVQLGDGNDRIEYAAPHQASVGGERGNDLFLGALRRAAPGRAIEPVFYAGGTGTDTVSYRLADRGVRVDTDDNFATDPGLASDGRPGIDRESVPNDFEIIEGSNFDDTLIGSDGNEVFRGLNGNDMVAALGGDDFIDEGSAPNGADTLGGGLGTGDRISYGTRTTGGVEVSLDSVRNDGATGEQDNVGGSVEHIGGTNFRDTLVGNGRANTIDGFGGPDTIGGLGGNDTLSAGAGNNGIVAGTGNDVVFARNGTIDDVDCGDNTDTLDRDTQENRVTGCERGQVGVLRLTPASVRAKAGEPAPLRLSWRHPRAWRQLRTIELRVTRDGMPVGEVTIDPRRQRIGADGAVSLARRRARLTLDGSTVAARLALRLDESLAGQRLQAEVEATDRRGRRQLERDAATVHVTD